MKKVSKLAIFTLLFVSSLTIMVGAVIAPSLAGIIKNLNFGYEPSWLITLPSLGVVVFSPFVGRLLNKIGPYKLLTLSLVPYGVLGLAGAFIANDYLLILDRFLLGVVTVTVMVSVTSLIADLFKGEARMKMIAWQGMSVELRGVLFLAIGGVLGEINWQFPFYIYLVAIFSLVLVIKFIPKVKHIKIEKNKENSSTKENRREVKLIFTAALLAMMLFFIVYVTLPLYLAKAFEFTESKIGYYMAFISLMAILMASQMPKVVKVFGEQKTVSIGFIFFMFGYLLLAIFMNLPLLISTAVFIGVGFGLTIPLLNHMMIEASTIQTQGKNLGLYSMGVFGGQFLSTFILYISDNYMAIYSIATVLSVLISSILFYLFQKLSNPKTENNLLTFEENILIVNESMEE